MSEPVEVTTVAQWKTALQEADAANRAVIADFRAVIADFRAVIADFRAEWCAPCKQIAPLYAKLAAEHPDATWLRVDVEGQERKKIAEEHTVKMMPSFLVIRNGEVVDSLRGADPDALNALALKHAATARSDHKVEQQQETPDGKAATSDTSATVED